MCKLPSIIVIYSPNCHCCVQVYLTITEKQLNAELFSRAIAKLELFTKDNHAVQESVLDLLQALAIYQPLDKIQDLYNRTAARLKDTTDHKEQKKYYRSEYIAPIFCELSAE